MHGYRVLESARHHVLVREVIGAPARGGRRAFGYGPYRRSGARIDVSVETSAWCCGHGLHDCAVISTPRGRASITHSEARRARQDRGLARNGGAESWRTQYRSAYYSPSAPRCRWPGHPSRIRSGCRARVFSGRVRLQHIYPACRSDRRGRDHSNHRGELTSNDGCPRQSPRRQETMPGEL